MRELLSILHEIRPEIDFENETKLIDDGLLDSFDIISIVGELNEHFDIEIRNVLGQIVCQAMKTDVIDISAFENGVYFLIISNKNGAKTITKVIKE